MMSSFLYQCSPWAIEANLRPFTFPLNLPPTTPSYCFYKLAYRVDGYPSIGRLAVKTAKSVWESAIWKGLVCFPTVNRQGMMPSPFPFNQVLRRSSILLSGGILVAEVFPAIILPRHPMITTADASDPAPRGGNGYGGRA